MTKNDLRCNSCRLHGLANEHKLALCRQLGIVVYLDSVACPQYDDTEIF